MLLRQGAPLCHHQRFICLSVAAVGPSSLQELVEAIVLPIQHKDRFEKLGIRPPKGVLLYGAPGTGKTLLARACAAQTNATFLKLAGPQLVQMFIGDGAKMVRALSKCCVAKQVAKQSVIDLGCRLLHRPKAPPSVQLNACASSDTCGRQEG